MISQDASFNDTSDIQMKVQNCMLKALKSSQYLIDSETAQEIRLKIQQINNTDTIVSSVQFFLFSLINKLHLVSQRTQKLDTNTEDYQNLENCVQKAEAQIRKHIRLEQQLKLYMDGLEDRIEELEKQLKLETKKYHQLFQSTKSLDLEKKQLMKKLKNMEQKLRPQKQIKVISQKASKILLSQPSLYESNSNPYYVPSSTQKYRLMRNKKSTDKSSEISKNHNHNQVSNKRLLDNDIQVSLNNSPQKKRSIQEGVVSHNQEQFTKTIHLKEGYRKHSRKLMKFSTQQSKNKKEVRCNSVCQ